MRASAEGLFTENPAVLATQNSSSTVDEPQSAPKASIHSYLSESRGGHGPTWLSEGGRVGTETGKLAAGAEDGGADSDHGRALGDGHLKIVAHAHGELGQRQAHIPLQLVTQLA